MKTKNIILGFLFIIFYGSNRGVSFEQYNSIKLQEQQKQKELQEQEKKRKESELQKLKSELQKVELEAQDLKSEEQKLKSEAQDLKSELQKLKNIKKPEKKPVDFSGLSASSFNPEAIEKNSILTSNEIHNIICKISELIINQRGIEGEGKNKIIKHILFELILNEGTAQNQSFILSLCRGSDLKKTFNLINEDQTLQEAINTDHRIKVFKKIGSVNQEYKYIILLNIIINNISCLTKLKPEGVLNKLIQIKIDEQKNPLQKNTQQTSDNWIDTQKGSSRVLNEDNKNEKESVSSNQIEIKINETQNNLLRTFKSSSLKELTKLAKNLIDKYIELNNLNDTMRDKIYINFIPWVKRQKNSFISIYGKTSEDFENEIVLLNNSTSINNLSKVQGAGYNNLIEFIKIKFFLIGTDNEIVFDLFEILLEKNVLLSSLGKKNPFSIDTKTLNENKVSINLNDFKFDEKKHANKNEENNIVIARGDKFKTIYGDLKKAEGLEALFIFYHQNLSLSCNTSGFSLDINGPAIFNTLVLIGKEDTIVLAKIPSGKFYKVSKNLIEYFKTKSFENESFKIECSKYIEFKENNIIVKHFNSGSLIETCISKKNMIQI